jgi:hypothetical protein
MGGAQEEDERDTKTTRDRDGEERGERDLKEKEDNA